MEGRNGMAMPGPASYYMHRGMAGSNSGAPTPLHPPQGMRPLPSPSTSLPGGLANVSGGTVSPAFQAEPLPLLSQPGINIGSQATGVSSTAPVKKKRGRPRKYGLEGAMSLGLFPRSSTNPGVPPGTPPKRGRGRPPGTGRKQQLASCGAWIYSSAGMGFTPHVITMSAGEDIALKIMTFSQQGPRSVCIISASGVVSAVTLRQPASSSGTVTYEGRFEILSLSGSFLLTDEGGSHARTGALTISLSSPDGRVIGGGVAGLLIAATPVQVIVGSFTYGSNKAKSSKPKPADSEGGSDATENPVGGERQIIPPSAAASMLPNPGLNPLLVGWPGPRTHNTQPAAAGHADIDLTRG